MRGKWTRLIVGEIRRLRDTLRRGWIGEVEEDAGRAVGYLSRVLSGEVPRLDVELLFCLFDRCILDPRELLRKLGFDLTFNPHSYLRRIRHQGVGDPEIAALEMTIEHVRDTENDVPCPELLQELAAIDTLRFSDVGAAASRTSSIIPPVAESGSSSLVIQTLGVLGSVRRVQGKFGLAARAYHLAFENAEPFSAERARLLERLAYLLANHGWLHAAEDSAAAAIEGFTLLHDQESLGKALITRAVMLRRMGAIEKTHAFYLSSLRYLPEQEWIYRFTAYQDLARCEWELGRLEEAQRYLTLAKEAHQTQTGLNWLKVWWVQSIIALKQGNFADAEQYGRIVVSGFDDETDPVDVALGSLHLAKTLLLRQKLDEITVLSRSMMRLLTPLKRNQVASALIAKFIKTAQAGQITLRFLERISRSLEAGRASETDARDVTEIESGV